MKVIAKSSERAYLCEVSHDEIEKFMGLYYGNMKTLAVGQEVDLGQGHNFAVRIDDACKRMTEAMKAFDDARKVMTNYAMVIANSRTEGGTA
jgi:hypothetical protein